MIEDGDMEDWVKVLFSSLIFISLYHFESKGGSALLIMVLLQCAETKSFPSHLLTGTKQSRPSGLCAREVSAVPNIQQPVEHAAVSGSTG